MPGSTAAPVPTRVRSDARAGRPAVGRASTVIATVLAVFAMVLVGPASGAWADQPKRAVAQGVTASGGLLVDPAGRVWVSDAVQGFCRIAEATVTTPGAIEPATCLGGTAGAVQKGPRKPGAAALLDPTPTAKGSGDELALVPDAAVNSAKVVRAKWDPATTTFKYASSLTLFGGDLRPVAVSVGPDLSAYVVFERARTVVRVVDPVADQPSVQTIAFLANVGARAVAAGATEPSGRVRVYVAEASGLTSFLAPLSGGGTGAPTASYAIGSPARLLFDQATGILYAGTASATSAGADTVTRVMTKTGQVEANWATGYSRIGGLALRRDLALVADDPGLLANPVQTAKGTVWELGELLPTIVSGPTSADGTPSPDPAVTNDATPSFTIAVAGQVPLQCAFDNVNWTSCSPGVVTASPALADGPHRFGVRVGAVGTPVERAFTVDATAPAAPEIRVPANGSTIGKSVALDVVAEAGAVLRCAIDSPESVAGTVCTNGQTLTFTTAGEHVLRIIATDAAGNVGPARTSTFTVDLAAPAPVITVPSTDGQTMTSTATFEFNAGSAQGVTFRCRIDSQAFETCTSPKSYTGLTAGAHTFTVEARSAVGNTATASRGFQFVVPDTRAPVVSATPGAGTYDVGQQVSLSADEPASIFYTTDGSTPTTSSTRYTSPIVLNANVTLRFLAVDTAGNASTVVSQAYVVRPKPTSTEPHDYDGDGKIDLLALTSTGQLWLYRGNGTGGWLGWGQIASGWSGVNAVIAVGDWTGDARPDVLARASNGDLRLHRGDGAGGIGAAEVIATGWGGLSMIFSPGDWDGDGKRDLLARDASGNLMLYPGNGTGGLGNARQVGTGWNVMTSVFGPGDFDGDGSPDVIARNSSGALLLYPGDGRGGWKTSRSIGSGWNVMTAILGPGDVDGDGNRDVVARDGSGQLLLYPGDGRGGWRTVRLIGTGWGGMTVIS